MASGLVAVDIAAGALLVSGAEMEDVNFSKSVVLLLDVNADGALGVVINKVSPVRVDDVLEGWGEFCAEPEVLFRGGPVATDSALAVARMAEGAEMPGVRPVSGSLVILDLDTPRELIAGRVEAVRIYAGYAGWGAGQLEREVEQGDWYVVAGRPGDMFLPDPRHLRRQVLQRQSGDLAFHATRPFHPDAN